MFHRMRSVSCAKILLIRFSRPGRRLIKIFFCHGRSCLLTVCRSHCLASAFSPSPCIASPKKGMVGRNRAVLGMLEAKPTALMHLSMQSTPLAGFADPIPTRPRTN